MNNTYRINETCDLLENNNSTIVFLESTKKVFILNDIENEIFNLIKEKNILGDIIEKLENKYHSNNEIIKKDVLYFINNLLKANLIIEETISQ